MLPNIKPANAVWVTRPISGATVPVELQGQMKRMVCWAVRLHPQGLWATYERSKIARSRLTPASSSAPSVALTKGKNAMPVKGPPLLPINTNRLYIFTACLGINHTQNQIILLDWKLIFDSNSHNCFEQTLEYSIMCYSMRYVKIALTWHSNVSGRKLG